MTYHSINCKLGNMRKAQDWTIYPIKPDSPNSVIIQCDKRIAEIFVSGANCGFAQLSDGLGGHQGFIKLMPALGSVKIPINPEIISELRNILGLTCV